MGEMDGHIAMEPGDRGIKKQKSLFVQVHVLFPYMKQN